MIFREQRRRGHSDFWEIWWEKITGDKWWNLHRSWNIRRHIEHHRQKMMISPIHTGLSSQKMSKKIWLNNQRQILDLEYQPSQRLDLKYQPYNLLRFQTLMLTLAQTKAMPKSTEQGCDETPSCGLSPSFLGQPCYSSWIPHEHMITVSS